MDTTDKITLKNIKIYAYHGVFEEEQIKGQNFYIDVEMFLSLRAADTSDDLEATVDYSGVFDVIQDVSKNNKFRLIEKLAGEISREILSRYKKIREIVVSVRKPEAPMEGEFDWVEVEIKRSQDDI